MLIGVVSDTHNNLKNIDKIIDLFNCYDLEFVIHTGDITNSVSLEKFKRLNTNLIGVYGNNDLLENNLEEVCNTQGFKFEKPPLELTIANTKISVFHEPDNIHQYLIKNKEAELILHGHTHKYRYEKIKQKIIFNPGESAGLMEGYNSIGIIDLPSLKVDRIFF